MSMKTSPGHSRTAKRLPTSTDIQETSKQTADQDNFRSHLCRPGSEVQRLLSRHRQAHTIADLDRDQSFSWARCFISLVSYALLLSDVLRTGLGIRTPPPSLVQIEPDSMIFIGPTAYPVNHLTVANATLSGTGARLWPYKYDTTSVALRALAEHLGLAAWPQCVHYRVACDESLGLSHASVFLMIDSLIDGISTHKSILQTEGGHSVGHIVVRTENEFRDRLYHFALPWFFQQTIKRTNQAIHRIYRPTVNSSSVLCGSWRSARPFSCSENWTRQFPGQCSGTRTLCDQDPRVWEYIPTRLKILADQYPDHLIDFVVVEGMEDYTRAAMTYQGRKFFDVVLLSRARLCNAQGCTTVAVDDFRYEGSSLVMNATSWFVIVAALRVVGQAYTWLRVLLIVQVCHAVRQRRRTHHHRVSVLAELRSIVRTIFLIPSQVVIYGSMFPISLYTLAHLIDSPAIYEMVSIRYNSLLGEFTWNVSDFVSHCAVSMRTVWVLSSLCHFALMGYTKCVWSPASGIPGVPELFISFVASLTIFAQYRTISMRSTKVLQVEEVVPSDRIRQLRAHTHGAPRSSISQLLFGSSIDYQCIQSALIALVCISMMLPILQRLVPWLPSIRLTIVSRSFGPYSAGSLWSCNRLVVSWPEFNYSKPSSFGAIERPARRGGTTMTITTPFPTPTASLSTIEQVRVSMKGLGFMKLDAQASRTASLQVRQEMRSIGKRTREFESAVYLINLAVMTDPITMLQLRFFTGCKVGLYESKLTQQCFLVPYDLRTSSADIAIAWDELNLVAVVNTKDLDWDDLLRCG